MNAPGLSVVAAFVSAVALVAVTAGRCVADDYVRSDGMSGGARVGGFGARCAAFGPDYAAVEGGDTCVRIGGHVRVQFGGSNASLDPIGGWAAGHASSATLHVEGPEATPTGATSHLRIHGGLEYPDPFR